MGRVYVVSVDVAYFNFLATSLCLSKQHLLVLSALRVCGCCSTCYIKRSEVLHKAVG